MNLNYSLLNATFLENLTLSSNSPAADADGDIFVHPGDTMPLMPQNRVVLDVEYQATPQWSIGADAKLVSSQYLVGDESNQEPKLPAYGVRQPAHLSQGQQMDHASSSRSIIC